MFELLKLIVPGLKTCPECGATNVAHYSSHCMSCGARVRNRNPIVRFVVTLLAAAIVGAVIWWKLKR